MLGYIKYSRDKTKLRNYIVHNPRMKLEKEAAQVIKIITKTPIKSKREEKKQICVRQWIEMIEDGRREATVRILSGLIKDGILSMEEAASRAGMSVEELKIDIEIQQKNSRVEKEQKKEQPESVLEKTISVVFLIPFSKRYVYNEKREVNEMNYTYILQCSDGTYYTGWTNDIAKRLKTHNEGKVQNTQEPVCR